MIDDFKILGIEQTNDIELIKAAYRKRVKEIHPDICPDDEKYRNHLLFIEINKAYKRLLERKESVEEHAVVINEKINGIILHKDPAFVYYKAGIKCLQKVHPSVWTKNSVEESESIQVIRDLFTLLPKSYYYFSIVVFEYSKSIWVGDSKEKMETIEKRTRQYKDIIESFHKWPNVKHEREKRLNGIIERTKELEESEGKKLKWPR